MTSTEVSLPDDRPVEELLGQRAQLIDNLDLGGIDLCRRLSAATDNWIIALAVHAERTTQLGHGATSAQPEESGRDGVSEPGDGGASPGTNLGARGYALIAVGGYGREELAPFSDIDLVVVHDGSVDHIDEFAAAIWYPIWDAGLKLGHAVRTVDEHLSLVRADLDTATASIDARLLHGDPELFARVCDEAQASWKQGGWLDLLRERVERREIEQADIAYTLEPDLKEGHGGLRDAQSMRWGYAGGLEMGADDRRYLSVSFDILLAARVALHRSSGRANEVLRLDLQDAVAELLGVDADELMATLSASARHIAWLTEVIWAQPPALAVPPELLSPGIWLRDGEIWLDDEVDVASDPSIMLRIATAAARRQLRISRASLDRLSRETPTWPTQWPPGLMGELADLLLEGHDAIPVIEALDQHGLFALMLPEWTPNRSRPQRNAYHRFTVDRHLWEAAANAAELADTVGRPDLLVLGALFHDIGKGYPGDHTEVGMRIVEEMAPRLGADPADTKILVKMVEHHLLLPDIALRRDVTDPTTIGMVAQQVETPQILELLHALTIADSKATGPSAWSDWKAELVDDLVGRVRHVVAGGAVDEVVSTPFPDNDTMALLEAATTAVERHGDDRIVVVYVDLPGALYRIAGALSLHGLDVVTARVYSEQPQLGKLAMAAAEFRIEPPDDGVEWADVASDVRRALVAQLAIDARLAERVATYRRRRRVLQAARPVEPSVRFDDEASTDATVIEVRAATRIGILYAITRALAGTGCDVRHANVQTVGSDAFDTFYVRNWSSELITDPQHRAEIERAVLYAVRDDE